MERLKTFVELFQRQRRPCDFVVATAFMAFAVVSLMLLPQETRWVEKTPLFAQPAFWPAIGIFMMVGFGAVHLIGSIASERSPGRGKEVLYWAQSLEFVAWFLAYVLAVPVIGYLPASILFSVLLVWRLGYRSPQSFAIAAIFGFAVVAVFKAGLNVKVPSGALYAYLPDSIRTFMMVNF